MRYFKIFICSLALLQTVIVNNAWAESQTRQQSVVIGIPNLQNKVSVVKEIRTPLGASIKFLSNGKRVYTHLPIMTSEVYRKLPAGGLLVDDYVVSTRKSKNRFLIRVLIQKTFDPQKPKIGMRKNLILAITPVGGIVFITSKGRQAYYPIKVIRSQHYKNLKPGESIVDDFCMSSNACLREGAIKITKPENPKSLPKVQEIKPTRVG